jgi:hypothetical protein
MALTNSNNELNGWIFLTWRSIAEDIGQQCIEDDVNPKP